MVGDSAAAFGCERELLTFHQTLTFSLLGSDLLDAFNQELQSKRAAFYQRKALVGLSAAQLYWRNGYYEHAREFLDSCLGTRKDFFSGLVYSLHYNLQLGDTDRARARLAQLVAIDSGNALSKAFGKVLRTADSINASPDPAVRSRMHMEIAKIFHNIELNDEAVDEAERAIGADPRNIRAYTFLALQYQMKLHARAALGLFRQAHAAVPKNVEVSTSVDALSAYLAMQ
jgi:tetratricopeptide (TPR) repeat protein